MKNPLFVQYVAERQEYHISDEILGAIYVFDRQLKKLGEYRSPDIYLRPVQILHLKGLGKMLVACSLPRIKTLFELFDLNGQYVKTFTRFSEAPCHVAKMTSDDDENIFAADSFGRLYKIDRLGNIIWKFCESEIRDRYKYVKYHQAYLYLSDGNVLKRFKV